MKPRIIRVGTVEREANGCTFANWSIDPSGATEGWTVAELEEIAALEKT